MTTLNKEQKKVDFECDVVLVSIGRRPNTKNLNLEKIGIKTNKNMSIIVDKSFQTNVKNIYAIGDVIDGPMLAHKAEEEGIATAELIAGQSGHVNYDVIPGVIYTYPEVASIGKKYIRKKAIENIREKLEFAQKKESDFTKEEMRKMIAKEEKKIIKSLGLRGGLTTILAMFGIANF